MRKKKVRGFRIDGLRAKDECRRGRVIFLRIDVAKCRDDDDDDGRRLVKNSCGARALLFSFDKLSLRSAGVCLKGEGG